MTTILTTDVDYDLNDGEMELANDEPSYRRFWAAVLAFADAEGAKEVVFDLSRGDDCLSVLFNGQAISLVPPPEGVRKEILNALFRLACGGRLGGLLDRLLSSVGVDRSGSVINRHAGREIQWRVTRTPTSVLLRPITTTTQPN